MSESAPPIRTKVRTPRRQPTLLRRQRLLDFLHSNIDHRLILIAAGAGYGKTTLLVDYAHDTELPICWYRLDASDSSVLTFIEYLAVSIRQRFPQFGGPVLERLNDHSGPPEAVEPFVRLIISEIEEKVPHYFVIVLDDYHEVIDSEPVNALVDGLLRHLPEHCHIVLASRGIPRRLTLTRLAASQQVVGLGVDSLRFNVDEIHGFLQKLGRTDLTPEQVNLLAERSEGWITGILLAAQTDWTGTTRDILEISGAAGGVFEYMAEEILRRQPRDVQSFLLGSAVFSEMTPPLCDSLLGISSSAQILRQLAEQNLFTSPLDAEGTWYRYHQLFREFLAAKLEKEDPHRFRGLSLRHADIMIDQGDWPLAIDGYLAAQAFEKAADAIEAVVQDNYDSGKWESLKTWIDSLPEGIATEHPRLLLFRAKVHTETGELNQATALLDRSHRAYMDRQDHLGVARVLVQRAVVQRFRGRPRDAMENCHAALEMVEGKDLFTAMRAHRNLGICHNMQGQFTEGIREMREALRLAEKTADDVYAAYIAHDMGNTELIRGKLVPARKYFHRALLNWRKTGNPSRLSMTLQGLGVVHQYLGQYAQAENRFQESLAKALVAADTRLQAYSLTNQGDLRRDIGRHEDALTAYREALELASSSEATHLIIYLLAALGLTYRCLGDSVRAHQVVIEALDQVDESQMGYEAGLCHLCLGVLAADEQKPSEARSRLERAHGLFAQTESRRDHARTHLHLASLALRQGGIVAVREHLATVARMAGELGSHQFIVGEGPSILPLLREGAEQGIQGLDYPRIRSEIGRLFPSAKESARLEVVSSGLSLEFLGLSGGQVLKEGRIVSDWESDLARIMAFLFVSRAHPLRRDQVIDMLWPDVSPARGKSRFYATMYRLRIALFRDLIIHQDRAYRVNPDHQFRYDVSEFQRLAKLGQGDSDSAHMARGHAIELYRSPFLEGCDDDWCLQIRQSLQRDMIELLLTEARDQARAGASQEAETLYLRVLGIDSFDERAHRGAMWCRATSGDRAGAVRQYRECESILGRELDTDPSPATLALYEAILADHPGPTSP